MIDVLTQKNQTQCMFLQNLVTFLMDLLSFLRTDFEERYITSSIHGDPAELILDDLRWPGKIY